VDANGNFVPNGTVVALALAGSGTIAFDALVPLAPVTAAGVAASTFVSGGRPGQITVIAVVGAFSDFLQVTIEGATIGAASSITVSAEPDAALGENILVTATVTNDADEPVAGVLVRFSDNPSVASVDSNVKTTNAAGEASAIFTADEIGTRAVTATVVNLVDGVIVETALSGSTSVNVAEVGAAGLTSTTSFSAWISSADTTASALFAALADADILWLWDGSAWVSYAVLSGGTELPGSVNFDITLGAILFIG
jgi:hypothetical protein